jgi:hypothetical protein
MSKYFRQYETSVRCDGLVNVWTLLPWPDDYLDSNPDAADAFLRSTGGWRAHAWQVVHVASSVGHANVWIQRHRKGA